MGADSSVTEKWDLERKPPEKIFKMTIIVSKNTHSVIIASKKVPLASFTLGRCTPVS